MSAPLVSAKLLIHGRKIAVAITLPVLMSIAPHEASAKGGTFHLSTHNFFSAAQAAPVASPRAETTTETLSPTIFGSCGGRRIRDPNTHRCRGPADF